MDAILLQFLNGLDKGGAYALIALGLTLIFGTLGVVNFAHGALFMIGAFCAVGFHRLLTMSKLVKDESITFFDAYKEVPYLTTWFGDFGATLIDYAVPLSILLAIPILVTFGLAIVLQEIVKAWFGANPIPAPAPEVVSGSVSVGALLGLGGGLYYPWWRLIYFVFSLAVIGLVFAFLKYTTFGMVVRAGMRDREMVGLFGINIQQRFTIVFAIAVIVAGVAGLMYAPILSPHYFMGMEFLVLSFVVVVVGGMGSLEGAVLAGFLLGIVQSLAAMNQVKALIPGIDQVIIYLVAIVVLLVRPRGLLGRAGVMET